MKTKFVKKMKKIFKEFKETKGFEKVKYMFVDRCCNCGGDGKDICSNGDYLATQACSKCDGRGWNWKRR